jgi:hypothetical protein
MTTNSVTNPSPAPGDFMVVAIPGWLAKCIRIVTRLPVNHAVLLGSQALSHQVGAGSRAVALVEQAYSTARTATVRSGSWCAGGTR